VGSIVIDPAVQLFIQFQIFESRGLTEATHEVWWDGAAARGGKLLHLSCTEISDRRQFGMRSFLLALV